MILIQRRKKILELLRDNGSVSVSALSELFSVSEETIRRDLQKMEEEGLLKRAYGGAFLGDVVRQDVPISIRRNTYREGKCRIGRVCAEMINNGDTIMLDSSSTALRIASEIKGKSNLIVITNSLDILVEVANSPEIHVISTGGDLDNASLSFTGMTAIENLAKFNVDKAFVSCTGVSLREDHGFQRNAGVYPQEDARERPEAHLHRGPHQVRKDHADENRRFKRCGRRRHRSAPAGQSGSRRSQASACRCAIRNRGRSEQEEDNE